MSKVLSLKEDSFDGSDGTRVICWKVELDDKTNPVPCYSAEAGKLKVGEPLPDGWSVQVSKKGKDYLQVPKAGGKGGGGFAAAYRNTREGQLYEQERMDRRTSLMQTVTLRDTQGLMGWTDEAENCANKMYAWLRKTSGADHSTASDTGGETGSGKDRGASSVPAPPSTSPEGPTGADLTTGGSSVANNEGGDGEQTGAGKADGEAATRPGSCAHEMTSPLKPDGRPFNGNFVRCLECGYVLEATDA